MDQRVRRHLAQSHRYVHHEYIIPDSDRIQSVAVPVECGIEYNRWERIEENQRKYVAVVAMQDDLERRRAEEGSARGQVNQQAYDVHPEKHTSKLAMSLFSSIVLPSKFVSTKNVIKGDTLCPLCLRLSSSFVKL